MELYEAWQRRRFRKFRFGSDPYRAGGELNDDPRITQEDVVAGDNMAKAHELLPVGSPEYLQAGRRPPDSAFQIEAPNSELPQATSRGSDFNKEGSNSTFAPTRAFANGIANGKPPLLVDIDRGSGTPSQAEAGEREASGKEEQGATKSGWQTYQNPAVDIEMEELGGTRHILRDFQEQLQTLRGSIALLSSENGDLRRKLSGTEADLKGAVAAKAEMESQISSQRELLQIAQGDLKLTRNRESRLQRLQDSLKQLMAEKDSKLNNDSINSRAVVERTNALKGRIEELERQLATHQANGYMRSPRASLDQENLRTPGNVPEPERGGARSDDAALLEELQRLRAENKALQKQLQAAGDAAKAAAHLAESDTAALRAELREQEDELQAARLEAQQQGEAVQASQREVKALAAEKAAAQASAEEAREALHGLLDEQKAAKTRVAELERSCEEAASSGKASAKNLQELRDEHKQVVLQLNVMEEQHRASLRSHDACKEQLQQDFSDSVRRHEELLRQVTALELEASGLREGLAETETAHQKAVDNHASKQAELQRHCDGLFEELAQARKACTESKQKLEKEREDKAATAAELAGIMALVSDERMTSEKYAKEARDARAAAAELERELTAAKEEAAEAKEKLSLALSSVDEEQAVTRGVLQEAQGRGVLLDEIKRELAAALAEVDHYAQQQAEHARAAEEWEKQAASLRSDLQTKEQQQMEAEQAAEAALAEAAKLKRQLAAATDEAAARKGQAESLQRQLESANSETLAARQAAAGLDMDLAAAHDKLASETALAVSAAAAAESRQQALQDQLHDIERSRSEQVLRLQEQLRQSVTSQKNLGTELENLRASAGESALRETQLSELAEQRLGVLSSDASTAVHVEKEKAAWLESENALLNQERADAERRLSGLEASCSSQAAQLSMAAAREAALADKLREEAASVQSLKRQGAEQAAHVSELRAALQHAREEGEAASQRHSAAIAERAVTLQELENVSRSLDELRSSSSETAGRLNARVAELEAALGKAEAELGTLERKGNETVEELRALLASAESAGAALKAETAGAHVEREAAEGALWEAELQRKQAETLAADLRARHEASARSISAAYGSEKDRLSEQVASLTAQLEGLRREHRAACSGLDAEKQRAKGLDLELFTLKQQHAKLQRECEADALKAAESAASLGRQLQSVAVELSHLKDAHRAEVAELERQTAEKGADLSAAQRASDAASVEAEQLKRGVKEQQRARTELGETVSALNADLAKALADRAAIQKAREVAEREAAVHKEASEQLRAALDATHETHHRTVADMHAVIKEMREAPERDHAALSFELWRLVQENDMLRARVHEFESDVKQLVATSQTLGHTNPKQKIQYHLRWKQELEELRNECTLLLRERFQLEQCIRYLAVRCGLSIAVERDVTASKERTPLNKLQPASLVPHYKFAARNAHVTDAAGDHIALEDLADDGAERASPTASEKGSFSTALSNRPDQAVEQQILARVAFVCNPPPSKIPENPLRPSLTPGALLALPSSQRGRDAVREWTPTATKAPHGTLRNHGPTAAAKPDALRSREQLTPPESSAGSFSDAGSTREERLRRASSSSEGARHRLSLAASSRNSSLTPSSSTGIPRLSLDTPSPSPVSAAERLSSRISRAFSGRKRT